MQMKSRLKSAIRERDDQISLVIRTPHTMKQPTLHSYTNPIDAHTCKISKSSVVSSLQATDLEQQILF